MGLEDERPGAGARSLDSRRGAFLRRRGVVALNPSSRRAGTVAVTGAARSSEANPRSRYFFGPVLSILADSRQRVHARVHCRRRPSTRSGSRRASKRARLRRSRAARRERETSQSTAGALPGTRSLFKRKRPSGLGVRVEVVLEATRGRASATIAPDGLRRARNGSRALGERDRARSARSGGAGAAARCAPSPRAPGTRHLPNAHNFANTPSDATPSSPLPVLQVRR